METETHENHIQVHITRFDTSASGTRASGQRARHQSELLHLPGRLDHLVGRQIQSMPEENTLWTKLLLRKPPKSNPRSRLLKGLRSLLPPKKKPCRLQSRWQRRSRRSAARRHPRPPYGKSEEPPPTPSMMRARQMRGKHANGATEWKQQGTCWEPLMGDASQSSGDQAPDIRTLN